MSSESSDASPPVSQEFAVQVDAPGSEYGGVQRGRRGGGDPGTVPEAPWSQSGARETQHSRLSGNCSKCGYGNTQFDSL